MTYVVLCVRTLDLDDVCCSLRAYLGDVLFFAFALHGSCRVEDEHVSACVCQLLT